MGTEQEAKCFASIPTIYAIVVLVKEAKHLASTQTMGNKKRRGALAKSISNWHLIGHSSNTGYCSLTMFLWYPVMDLARAPRRARSNARKKGSGYENAQNGTHSRTQSPDYARCDEGLWPNPYSELASDWLVLTPDIVFLPCFHGIRSWIWPEPLVAPRVIRALGTRMNGTLKRAFLLGPDSCGDSKLLAKIQNGAFCIQNGRK